MVLITWYNLLPKKSNEGIEWFDEIKINNFNATQQNEQPNVCQRDSNPNSNANVQTQKMNQTRGYHVNHVNGEVLCLLQVYFAFLSLSLFYFYFLPN